MRPANPRFSGQVHHRQKPPSRACGACPAGQGDSFDITVILSLNKPLVMELARSEYIERRENIIALGPCGTGKTHVALGLGLAACQKGLKVRFITAASLVHELIEARDDKRLLRLQKQLTSQNLLIIPSRACVAGPAGHGMSWASCRCQKPEPNCCSN